MDHLPSFICANPWVILGYVHSSKASRVEVFFFLVRENKIFIGSWHSLWVEADKGSRQSLNTYPKLSPLSTVGAAAVTFIHSSVGY